MKIFKQILGVVLRLGVSAFLILLLFKFQKVDSGRLLENIRFADRIWLSAAFLLNFAVYILCLFRWNMLLKSFDIRLPLKRIIISFSGGVFFSSLLPSTIGGDLMRSLDLSQHTKRTKEVVATVLLDRLSGCVGLVIVALAALILGWRFIYDKSVLFPVAVIVALMLLVLLVLFNDFLFSRINKLLHSPDSGRIRRALKSLHEEIHYFKRHKGVMLKNLFLSVLIQIGPPIAFYITALSLGQKIDLIYFFVFLPIIGAITLLPISIGGLGLRENASVFFFAQAGMPKDLAGAMAFFNSIFVLVLAAIGGMIYVLTLRHRRLQPSQSSAS